MTHTVKSCYACPFFEWGHMETVDTLLMRCKHPAHITPADELELHTRDKGIHPHCPLRDVPVTLVLAEDGTR